MNSCSLKAISKDHEMRKGLTNQETCGVAVSCLFVAQHLCFICCAADASFSLVRDPQDRLLWYPKLMFTSAWHYQLYRLCNLSLVAVHTGDVDSCGECQDLDRFLPRFCRSSGATDHESLLQESECIDQCAVGYKFSGSDAPEKLHSKDKRMKSLPTTNGWVAMV